VQAFTVQIFVQKLRWCICPASGVAKGGPSAPGGTFMGASLWAVLLYAMNLQRLYWDKCGFNVGTLLAVEGRFLFWV